MMRKKYQVIFCIFSLEILFETILNLSDISEINMRKCMF